MTLVFTNFITGGIAYIWLSLFVFLIVLTEEAIGKWSFYQTARKPFFLR
jgi:hypothetical protein